MHLCEGWVWENAYSSLKSVETPINIRIFLFDNHSHVKNQFSCYSKYILGDVTHMFKNIINIFSAKICIMP